MTNTYCLSGHLDSTSAPPLALELIELRGQSLHVDASAVKFAGTLSLQVLIAAKKQWYDDGHDFRLTPFSSDFANAANGLGINLSAMGATDADILPMEGTA